VEIPQGDWVDHPYGDDVAVARIDTLLDADSDVKGLDWSALAGSDAAMRDRMDELNVGVGDEIIMLGRFVSHAGIQRNQALARFGNIAMMPGEPVRDGRGVLSEAFLVEMRSTSGFSGSPVFVYMGPATYRGNRKMMPFYSETIGLIGIDTGHTAVASGVIDRRTGTLVDPSWIVEQNSGFAIVAPVWKISEILEQMPPS
jgi:hypothetical protein